MKRLLIPVFAAAAACEAFGLGVGSSTVNVTFDEEDRGAVESVKSANGIEFASRLARFPLFQIECCRAGAFTDRTTVTSKLAKRFSVQKTNDGVVLIYEDVGEAIARAVCVVAAEGKKLLWRIEVMPKAGWALLETQYPMFALSERLGNSAADDAIVMGKAKGGIVRHPMDPRREYWKERHVGDYPGSLVAQFGCFYDERGGLYTAAEDDQGHTKQLLMDRWWRVTLQDGTFREGDFLFRWSRFGYTDATDCQAYDIVMSCFEGPAGEPTTWYDAADLYKAWARTKKWCQTPFLQRDDIPAWMKNAPAVMSFDRAWFDRPSALHDWLVNYWSKKFPGTPLIAILIGWEKHGDWIAPDYFPCYPDDASFAAMMKDLKAAGGRPWLWPGGHHWNLSYGKRDDGSFMLDFRDDFYKRAAPHAVCRPTGEIWLDKLDWLAGGESATMCPADPWSRDWWNKDVARELVKRGAELVQADQDVGARVQSCWSTKHGHAPGPGKWMTDSLRLQFETMLAEMRKLQPDALFSFEEPNEYYNDILAVQDYRDCRFFGSEWASVYTYLYHEYVAPMQAGIRFDNMFWLAHSAADGQMPRLPVAPEAYVAGEALVNGGFETLTKDGKSFVAWERPDRHHVVTDDVKEGKYALAVEAKGERVQVARNLPTDDQTFKPGMTIRFSAWLKSLKYDRRNALSVAALAKGVKSLGSVSLPAPKVEEGWKRLAADLKLPAGTKNLRLMNDAWGESSFLVDGVTCEVVAADGTAKTLMLTGDTVALDFCERWVKIYHGEGRPWLAHGRGLRPPELQCAWVPYEENFRGRDVSNNKPVVFQSAWASPDGREALFFVNATAQNQPIAYRWRNIWTKTALKPFELRLVLVAQPESKEHP